MKVARFCLEEGYGARLVSVKATLYFHRMSKTSQRASDVTEGSRKWYAIEQEL